MPKTTPAWRPSQNERGIESDRAADRELEREPTSGTTGPLMCVACVHSDVHVVGPADLEVSGHRSPSSIRLPSPFLTIVNASSTSPDILRASYRMVSPSTSITW